MAHPRTPAVVLLLSLALAAPGAVRAKPRPVTSAAAAIDVAIRACDTSWGRWERRRQHNHLHVRRDGWQATRDGESWRAWQGDTDRPIYEVSVPADGSPVDGETTCVAQMGWSDQEGPNRMTTGHFR